MLPKDVDEEEEEEEDIIAVVSRRHSSSFVVSQKLKCIIQDFGPSSSFFGIANSQWAANMEPQLLQMLH